MVRIEFTFQTYRHLEQNTHIDVYINEECVLTTPEIYPSTTSVFSVWTDIPAIIKLSATTGARALVKKVSINNFTIDIFNLFPRLVNNQNDNYQVYLHNNSISFTIDDDNPTRWLMRNKNEILIDRTADILNDRDYNYE